MLAFSVGCSKGLEEGVLCVGGNISNSWCTGLSQSWVWFKPLTGHCLALDLMGCSHPSLQVSVLQGQTKRTRKQRLAMQQTHLHTLYWKVCFRFSFSKSCSPGRFVYELITSFAVLVVVRVTLPEEQAFFLSFFWMGPTFQGCQFHCFLYPCQSWINCYAKYCTEQEPFIVWVLVIDLGRSLYPLVTRVFLEKENFQDPRRAAGVFFAHQLENN